MFSVVINHYSGQPNTPHLAGASIFSAALSVRDPLVSEVLLIDGSLNPDPTLKDYVQNMGCRYLHAGRRLSFSEGYNFGVSHASEDWVVLCASDVFPSLGCYRSVADFLSRIDPDTVGCIITRLSSSDLPYQKTRFFSDKLCAVPIMTLNFNVMKRSYLEAIGGVPNEYSGNFNDVALSMSIHEDRKQIYMLPVQCLHYGSLTLQTGGSTVSGDKDMKTFAARNPHMVDPGSMWDLRLTPLLEPGLITALLRLTKLFPTRYSRSVATRWVLRLVPFFSAITLPP